MSKRDIEKEVELYQKVKANQALIPNDFTIGMGLLIKKAREEKELSQAQLAQEISRRQATISDFENGKVEISVLDLVLLSKILHKPLAFFFPKHILSEFIFEIDNSFEQEVLMSFKFLEHVGGADLAKELVDKVAEYFEAIASGEIDIPDPEDEVDDQEA